MFTDVDNQEIEGLDLKLEGLICEDDFSGDEGEHSVAEGIWT